MLLDNHANDYEQASLVNLLLFHSYHNYHHIPSHLNRLTCTNNYYFTEKKKIGGFEKNRKQTKKRSISRGLKPPTSIQ